MAKKGLSKKQIKGRIKEIKKRKTSNSRPRFMFEDYLVNCNDAIDQRMIPANGTYYRVVEDPEREKDIRPTSLWKFENLAESENMGLTIPAGEDIETQWKQVKDYSPSFNTSAEGAASMLMKFYKNRKTIKQKEKFLNEKGHFVKSYNLRPNDGYIQKEPDESGHVIFQPFEGFDLKEHVNKDFQVKPFISFQDDEEQ